MTEKGNVNESNNNNEILLPDISWKIMRIMKSIQKKWELLIADDRYFTCEKFKVSCICLAQSNLASS